jgi:hypothetical protein
LLHALPQPPLIACVVRFFNPVALLDCFRVAMLQKCQLALKISVEKG